MCAAADYVAPYSATAVRRLVGTHGGVAIGPCNMDEFGMGNSNASSHHGVAVNPFSPGLSSSAAAAAAAGNDADPHLSRQHLTPGGSSGGCAVAVATGAAFGALGSDTGGSVRLPAAFCGVVGLKPSYGRIPRHGLIAYASSLDTVGVLARCVGDAALLLDAVAGGAGAGGEDDTALRSPQPLDAEALHGRVRDALLRVEGGDDDAQRLSSAYVHVATAASSSTDFSGSKRRTAQVQALGAGQHSSPTSDAIASSSPLSGVRVGIPAEYSVAELPAAVRAAWEAGAAALEGAGAQIVTVSLPHTQAALPAYYVLACAEAASNLSRYDGLRFGHAAAAAAAVGASSSRLLDFITRSRSEAFGSEAQRRILIGNFVLSRAGRERYYEAASAVRGLVQRDFDAVFRAEASITGSDDDDADNNGDAMMDAFLVSLQGWRGGSADARSGVDVLLTPTAPALPWPLHAAATLPPVQGYLNDVMTVPSSLAGLPAISVPFGSAPLRQAEGAPRVPVGLQLIGRFGDERTLLQVAVALERAAPTPPARDGWPFN